MDITFMEPREFNIWMNSNIEYSHPNNWVLKSPEETFRLKKGDCHDQTLFEYDTFKKQWGNKYKPSCYFVISPDGSYTHSFLTYYDNGKYWWFENAWEMYKGIHGPYKNLSMLKGDVLTRLCHLYKGDPYNTFIGKWKTYKPGLDLKSFCRLQVD